MHSSIPKSGKTLVECVRGIARTIGERERRNEDRLYTGNRFRS